MRRYQLFISDKPTHTSSCRSPKCQCFEHRVLSCTRSESGALLRGRAFHVLRSIHVLLSVTHITLATVGQSMHISDVSLSDELIDTTALYKSQRHRRCVGFAENHRQTALTVSCSRAASPLWSDADSSTGLEMNGRPPASVPRRRDRTQ